MGCGARSRPSIAVTPVRYMPRLQRTRHFWQGRFGAVAMDEQHLRAAVRYVVLNPVRARLVTQAGDLRWSSARAHLSGEDDSVTTLAPVLTRFPDFAGYIATAGDTALLDRLRRAESIGRPAGDEDFMAMLEVGTGRPLAPARRGPKPASNG